MKEQIKRIIKFIALSLIHFKKSIENIKNNNDNVLNTYVETRLDRLKNRYIDWEDGSGENSSTIKSVFLDQKYNKNNNFKVNTGVIYFDVFTDVSNISIPQENLPSYKNETRKYLVDIKYILKPSTWDKTPSSAQAVKTESITKTISLQNSTKSETVVKEEPLFVKKWSSQQEKKDNNENTKKVKKCSWKGFGGWLGSITNIGGSPHKSSVPDSFSLITGDDSVKFLLEELKDGISITIDSVSDYKTQLINYVYNLPSYSKAPWYGNTNFQPTDIATKLGGKPFLLNDRDRFLLTFEEGGEITALNISINGDVNKIVEKVIVKIETCSDYLNS